MSTAEIPGDPPIALCLRRSARARRISLRVSSLDGRVTLTLPKGAPRDEAIAFARSKEDWLRRNLSRQPDPAQPMPGGKILFEGREVGIIAARTRAVALRNGGLTVPQSRPELTAARVAAFLKQAARDRLAPAVDRHAAVLGRRPGRLTLRDTRSRWGSCSPEGNLMFSWRLVMAPPAVLDYVAAHEVAHLVEMNHSAAFWAVVETLHPDHRAQRGWLRQNGAELHRFRFGD